MAEEEKLKLGKGAAFVKSRLKRLPQVDEVWEADFEALPKPIMQTETHYLGMVVTKKGGTLLADLTVHGRPTVNDLATLLVSPLTKLDRNSGPGYAVGVPFCTEGDSLCVVVSRACCPLPLPTKTVCTQPLIVTACPGIKCGGRILLALAAGQRKRDVAAQMECGVATVWRACERYRRDGLEGLLADGREGRSGRLEQITPVQRAQIVELACLEPIAKGLHITHWSSEDLARQAVEDGIVARSVLQRFAGMLHDVDLQPHRTRYWKTARLDARFKERAEQVLWCYGNAARLAEQGIWVVCVDEIPTFQVLERQPDPPGDPRLD